MKSIYICAVLVCWPAIAQTLTLANTANSALGMDFVSGDTFGLTITGAAAKSAVTVTATRDGVSTTPTPWYAGSTDESGNFSLTGTETDDYVAEYTQQWYVGGQPIGSLLDFEVIFKPSSLGVGTVDVATLPSNCPGTYGIMVDIKYQLKNVNGQVVATQTGIPMTPYEDVGSYHGNIGPVSGYPTSGEYAADDGTFHDVPVGLCANFAFSNSLTSAQVISVYIGNNLYQVRGSTRFTVSGPSAGHGSITNGSDVSKSR